MTMRAPRQRESCDACSASKLRCSKERPSCVRCSKREVPCHYSASLRTGRPPAKRTATQDQWQFGALQPLQQSPTTHDTMHMQQGAFARQRAMSDLLTFCDRGLLPTATSSPQPSPPINPVADGTIKPNQLYMPFMPYPDAGVNTIDQFSSFSSSPQPGDAFDYTSTTDAMQCFSQYGSPVLDMPSTRQPFARQHSSTSTSTSTVDTPSDLQAFVEHHSDELSEFKSLRQDAFERLGTPSEDVAGTDALSPMAMVGMLPPGDDVFAAMSALVVKLLDSRSQQQNNTHCSCCRKASAATAAAIAGES